MQIISTPRILNAIFRLGQRVTFLDVESGSVDFKVITTRRCYRARWDHGTHTIYVVSIREKFRYQIGEFDELADKMMKALNRRVR